MNINESELIVLESLTRQLAESLKLARRSQDPVYWQEAVKVWQTLAAQAVVFNVSAAPLGRAQSAADETVVESFPKVVDQQIKTQPAIPQVSKASPKHMKVLGQPREVYGRPGGSVVVPSEPTASRNRWKELWRKSYMGKQQRGRLTWPAFAPVLLNDLASKQAPIGKSSRHSLSMITHRKILWYLFNNPDKAFLSRDLYSLIPDMTADNLTDAMQSLAGAGLVEVWPGPTELGSRVKLLTLACDPQDLIQSLRRKASKVRSSQVSKFAKVAEFDRSQGQDDRQMYIPGTEERQNTKPLA